MKVPAIGNHIELYPYEGNKVNIYNKNTGKTFLVGEKEGRVLSCLDGHRTIASVQEECPFYTTQEIEQLIEAFNQIGLFEKQKKKINILKLKLRLFNPNKLFSNEGKLTKISFYVIMILCPVLLVAGLSSGLLRTFGFVNTTIDFSNIIFQYMNFDVVDYIWLGVAAFACLAIHELAHTITARYYNVNVPEIGVMLYCLIPCAYTNISNINLLKSKKQRLLVLLSGSFVNLGIVGVCWLMMNLIDYPFKQAFLLGVILINLGTLFMNGMVFLKFDGYYIAEVLFDEPKLKEKATLHFKGFLGALLSKDKKGIREYRAMMKVNSEEQLNHITYCVMAIVSGAYIPFLLISTLLSYLNIIW